MQGNSATDADCPGARRFAFVSGFQPPYSACEIQQQAEEKSGGWRDWFGFGKDDDQPQAEQPQQPQQPPQPQEQQ